MGLCLLILAALVFGLQMSIGDEFTGLCLARVEPQIDDISARRDHSYASFPLVVLGDVFGCFVTQRVLYRRCLKNK